MLKLNHASHRQKETWKSENGLYQTKYLGENRGAIFIYDLRFSTFDCYFSRPVGQSRHPTKQFL
jgi:hypothetical protein